MMAPVFGSYLQFIFVTLAVALLEPMYIITSAPFRMGISSSSAIAYMTNLLVTGIEKVSEDSTLPYLIV